MTGLPVVFVKTTCAQKEIVKETWSEGGSVAILKPDTWELDYFGSTSVKGRGNTTWKECPKKPYALKLDSKGVLLGMAKQKGGACSPTIWTGLCSVMLSHSRLQSAHRLIGLRPATL